MSVLLFQYDTRKPERPNDQGDDKEDCHVASIQAQVLRFSTLGPWLPTLLQKSHTKCCASHQFLKFS